MRPSVRPIAGFCSCKNISRPNNVIPLTCRGIRRNLSAEHSTLPPKEPPPPPPPSDIDPNTVSTPSGESQLLKARVFPIGSRRRRAALKSSRNIPFEQLPYQCFQEARAFLLEDRQEKIKEIESQRARIQRLQEQDTEDENAAKKKKDRMFGMRTKLDYLKIQADINDPLVKRKFEDGQGDPSKPIYRYLAERKWRARRRLVTEQRITQMKLVPDVLPAINLTADVSLYVNGSRDLTAKRIVPQRSGSGTRIEVEPGEFISSKVSETDPRIHVQIFDKGARLVTVAVVDPDVPNVEEDAFNTRCHFLAANIPISHTEGRIIPSALNLDSQIMIPWSPPYAQRGSPYHRLCIVVLQQPDGKQIDVGEAKDTIDRKGFSARALVSRHALKPIGAHLFRTIWDEHTDELMRNQGVEGVDQQLKRERIEPLPYKKKDGNRFR